MKSSSPHRLISLDTETTGLDFHKGERLVEVALVELIDRKPTGRTFHKHINPRRKVHPDAFRVHGLSDEFLKDKPLFRDIADEMMSFIGDGDLIIHNAEFDLTFLNGELAHAGMAPIDSMVLDTLEWVKTVEPGKRASLDAMADRHRVDRSSRLLHGALIDARLLADVYIAMTRHQSGLDLTNTEGDNFFIHDIDLNDLGNKIFIAGPDDIENQAHEDYLAALDKDSKGQCVWLKIK